MAISYSLGTMVETGASSVASLNVPTPSFGLYETHFIAVALLATTPTLVGPPTGYTQIGSTVGLGSTSNSALAVFYRKGNVAIPAGTATLTLSGSQTGRIAAVPFRLSGVDMITTIQSSATDSSGFVADTLTPTTSNAYLLGIFAGRGPAGDTTPFTFTPPSGMTEIGEIITTTSSGSEVAVEVCGLQLASSSATGNKTATIGTGSAPGHGGMSILVSTYAVPADGFQVVLDDGTGNFPYDVTSRVRLVDGVEVVRGRQDELSEVEPGTCTLTVENADGGFTPGSTVIASPSPIALDTQMRVVYTENGVTVPRFTGGISSLPVTWPSGSDLESRVKVQLVDAQAHAERHPLRSVTEEEYLVDGPVALYSLSEAAGTAAAGDTSGGQQANLTQAGSGTGVAFGSAAGPITDGVTAAQFADGKHLTTTLTFSATPTALSFDLFFSSPGSGGGAIAQISAVGGTTFLSLMVDGSGVVRLGYSGGTTLSATLAPSVLDGGNHHVEIQITATAFSLYLDGTFISTAAVATSTLSTNMVLSVGGYHVNIDGTSPSFVSTGTVFTGVIAQVAVFPSAISLARIAAHATAGTTGFANEPGTSRLTRIAGYAGVTLSASLEASQTNVPFVDFTGSTAADAIRDVVDAEMGLAYVGGYGVLSFNNRYHESSKSTPDATFAAEFLAEDTTFTLDLQGTVNTYTVTAQGTQIPQVVTSATSVTSHGPYASSKTYLVSTDTEALDRGNWVVNKHAEPQPRVGTLVLDLLTMSAAQRAAALALEPGSWVRITGLPSQTPGGTTGDFSMQGFTENRSLTAWTLTLNVVSRSLVSAAIYDDATYGIYDSPLAVYSV